MTFRKFKILLRIWKNRGIKALALRVFERLKASFRQKLAFLYMRVWRPSIIQEIQKFESDNPREVFNFAASKFLGGISPGQIPEEFVPLLSILKNLKPKIVVEIGTEKGGTFFCFCKLAPPDATIISIDLPPALFGGGYPKWRVPIYRAFGKPGQTLHFIRRDSHSQETLEKLKSILNDRHIDFLFIDADHTYEGVKKDFEMYSPLVRERGIIAFHDIVEYPKEYDNQVSTFWNEIKNKYRYEEFVKDWNQRWGGIGLLYFSKE